MDRHLEEDLLHQLDQQLESGLLQLDQQLERDLEQLHLVLGELGELGDLHYHLAAERPRSCNRPSIQIHILAPDIEPVHGTTMSSTHPSGLRRPSIQARASDLALVHERSFTGETST